MAVQNVSVDASPSPSLPLPTGASTETTLAALNTKVTTTANGVKVDGSAVTQPVSAASLPLPAGASTSAKQPALGTAGTPSTDVISVQGVAGGTALPISGTVTVNPSVSTRSDTFTATGNGVTVNVSASSAKSFSVQVKGTGAAATLWDVRLEGSLDNVNFTQVLQHTNTTGDGAVLYSGATLFPSLYFRARCAGLTLGTATNIVVTILGVD
jgi:hypothetical protein